MVAVHPDLHTVVANVAWVASGLIAPGVQAGSGRGRPLELPIRHVAGLGTGACGSSVTNPAGVPDDLPGEPLSRTADGWHATVPADTAASTMMVTNTSRSAKRPPLLVRAWRIVVDDAEIIFAVPGGYPFEAGLRSWPRRPTDCQLAARATIRQVVVVLLPGADRGNVVDLLREMGRQVGNLRGGGAQGAADRLFEYLEWAGTAASALSRVISPFDVDRLVLTRRYEMLLGAAPGLLPLVSNNSASRVLHDLVSTELDERVAAFDEVTAALVKQITRWSSEDRYVVLDTNVYLEHQDRLDDLNVAGISGALEAPIHVLVPMTVLDELDAAKRLHDVRRRGRALVALATIDRVVRANGVLHDRDQAAVVAGSAVPVPGQVTLEVLSETPDHVRLPNADAEIVDRAVAVQTAAGSPVTLVTFDTAMAFRAREAGLTDRKLGEDARHVDQQSAKKR